MKYSIITIAFFSLPILSGCSYEENTQEENIIKLSEYEVNVIAGVHYEIDVETLADNLVLINKDAKIASGWGKNNGKTILIKTVNVGKTSIILRDKDNYDISAEIKVESEYLSGDFNIEGERAEIVVSVDNKATQKNIESELKEIAKKASGTVYSFDMVNNKVTIRTPVTNGEETENCGIYEWTPNSLTIKMDGATNNYGFGVLDNNLIIIVQDYLSIYQSRYPEISIRTVKLEHYLSRK